MVPINFVPVQNINIITQISNCLIFKNFVLWKQKFVVNVVENYH